MLINLTPGSVALDVSDDRKVMYVHVMYIDSPDAARAEIKDGFERRVLQVARLRRHEMLNIMSRYRSHHAGARRHPRLRPADARADVAGSGRRHRPDRHADRLHDRRGRRRPPDNRRSSTSRSSSR